MTEISTTDDIFMLQTYEHRGKTYYDGNMYNVLSPIARRLVARGIASYIAPKEIFVKPVRKPVYEFINISDKVSIVILVKDALDYVKKCLNSVKKYTDNYELIIVDNGSNKETREYLNNIDWIDFTLITNKENKGFSYGNNQAIKIAKYDYICFLNSDTVVTPNWLNKLLKCFKINKDCGIASPTTCVGIDEQCDESLTAKRFGMTEQNMLDYASNLKEGYKASDVYGFCFVVKSKIFKEVGVFDYKRFKLGYTEEREFIWRAKKLGNYKSYWVKGAYVHHYGTRTLVLLGIDGMTYNIKARKEWKRTKHYIEPKFIENDVELGIVKKINISVNEKKIIVTANIGQFDNIIENHHNQNNCRFVMFTDDKNAKSSLWKLIQIRRKFIDSRREARMYKWLIHKYIPDAEYSLWIDANIRITTDINTLINKYLIDTDIAIQSHRQRNCIYKEAEECKRLKLDYVDVIEKQIARYELEGYPKNYGLNTSGILLRRHTDNVKRFNEAVWLNICFGSVRDQLSLDYIAWKLGIKINNLSESFDLGEHKSNKRQY